MDTGGNHIQRLVPIIEEYLRLKPSLQDSILQTGEIPREICENCIMAPKHRQFIDALSTSERQLLTTLFPVLKDYQVTKIEPSEYRSEISIESLLPIPNIRPDEPMLLGVDQSGGGKQDMTLPDIYGREVYVYSVPIHSDIFGSGVLADLFEAFDDGLDFCPHIDITGLVDDSKLEPVCRRTEYLLDYENYDKSWKKTLYLACPDCCQELSKFACPGALVDFEYFYRTHNCEWQYALFLNCLHKASKEFHSVGKNTNIVLLEPEKVLVFLHSKIDEQFVTAVKPTGIILFGSRSDMVKYLGLEVNIICISSDQYYCYNPQREVVKNISQVIQKMVDHLEAYCLDERGNDHDRYISAMARIGTELGFVPEKEYRKKGMSIDCVWLNRNGTTFAAIEVETSGNYKKDIISTWELEPEVAIILFNAKTDISIQELTNYALLKVMPHPFIIVNTVTGKLYQFEKQEVVTAKNLIIPKSEGNKFRDI